MSWRAQNRSQDAKIRTTRGTRSDCLIPESCGIQRYSSRPTAATSVYFKVICAQLSPVAIFPVLPCATKGLAIQFLGFKQRFGYMCSYCQEGRLSGILYASQ
jgi:hypothetical protein